MQTGSETDRMYPVTIYVVILSINSRVANSFRQADMQAGNCYISIEAVNIININYRSDQWVGLYPSDVSVIYEDSVTNRRQGWAWLDGSDVTWLEWQDDDPNISEGCARLISDKLLAGRVCTHQYYFICKQVCFFYIMYKIRCFDEIYNNTICMCLRSIRRLEHYECVKTTDHNRKHRNVVLFAFWFYN